MLVAGTRGALGAGLGLLLADRLTADQRRAVGWTLFLVGAISTIPLALEVFGGERLAAATELSEQTTLGPRSVRNQRSDGALAPS
jgi:hypothetical protein